ncbi:MarR family winged helix-turn-helix transcriptional regulator [Amycolatopsis pithecellobii]|uniref:MarR family transcriptional regulator n=1 Tax=Amycolatopsis pithecellobii TaxID=664692 RepID=A0A6N7Z3Z5_9PSEU|nr:MarR family winged helix-turn-helix transcriptional regulator [Amycolatopsis pithecellobii]MTD54914.1 MarR family transcriptional regulator [Amycolatopsis pithecellobii]
MGTGKSRKQAETNGPRWLNAAQLDAWRSFTFMFARLQTELEAQLQRDAQLSYVEYYVLAGLSEEPGRRMRMSRLALLTNAELSRLSHLISRLEKRGFVRREPDRDDRRYTNAILTDEGYEHLVRAAPGHVAKVRDLVIDVLDDEALTALRESSEQILHRIDGCP